MNNADWLDEDVIDSDRFFFAEVGVQQRWDELDPIEVVVLYDANSEKTYGERWEFGTERRFDPSYSFKIVVSERFGDWQEYENGATTLPEHGTVVEVELLEYIDHCYVCDFVGDIPWDNVTQFRVLRDPEND